MWPIVHARPSHQQCEGQALGATANPRGRCARRCESISPMLPRCGRYRPLFADRPRQADSEFLFVWVRVAGLSVHPRRNTQIVSWPLPCFHTTCCARPALSSSLLVLARPSTTLSDMFLRFGVEWFGDRLAHTRVSTTLDIGETRSATTQQHVLHMVLCCRIPCVPGI